MFVTCRTHVFAIFYYFNTYNVNCDQTNVAQMQRNENVGHPRYNVETYQFASHRVLSRTESNDHESITPDSDLIQPRSKAKRLANALPIALLPTIKCPFVLALRHACLSHFHVR